MLADKIWFQKLYHSTETTGILDLLAAYFLESFIYFVSISDLSTERIVILFSLDRILYTLVIECRS